jgi:hypothetical protein
MTSNTTPTDPRRLPLAEMEAIVARFHERTDAGQKANSPTKDSVKKAVKRQWSGRCPTWFNRLSFDVILRHGDALADLFCEFPDDLVVVRPYDGTIGYEPPAKGPKINLVEVMTQAAEWTDDLSEKGTMFVKNNVFAGLGALRMGPLRPIHVRTAFTPHPPVGFCKNSWCWMQSFRRSCLPVIEALAFHGAIVHGRICDSPQART